MQPVWIWAVPIVALLLAALLYFKFMRPSSSRDDRYSSEALLTPAQAELLYYLQTAFPGQAVLANVPLNKIVTIRRAAARHRAQDTLDTLQVDFVVCEKGGKAAFVFDVEAYRTSEARQAQHSEAVKNRILKSAGIRLIYIKDSTRSMPSPEEFRMKLSLAALSRSERAAQQRSVRQELEINISRGDQNFKPSGFRESEVMGMSRLMNLDPDSQNSALDPWAISRN